MAQFEATHLAFLLPRRLVREFHSVVPISTRIVRRSGQELSGGDTVAAEPAPEAEGPQAGLHTVGALPITQGKRRCPL